MKSVEFLHFHSFSREFPVLDTQYIRKITFFFELIAFSGFFGSILKLKSRFFPAKTSVATDAALSRKPFSRAVARGQPSQFLAYSPEWFSFLNGVTPGRPELPKPFFDCHFG
jgi:hypothetical protein